MSKSENEIITVSQSSGLASCFPTLLYFYIKAKEEFNFVFAPTDGAEAELLRKGQLNPLLGCMMVSPVYIKLYHRTNQQITTKMNAPEINKVNQACNYILIIFDFTKLKKIQSVRPHLYCLGYPSYPNSSELVSGRRDNSKGRGRGGGECVRTLRQGCLLLFFPCYPPFCRICNLAERGLADVKFHINAP